MADVNDLLTGAGGVVNETGTTAVTGNFYLVICLKPTTFTTFTEVDATGDALTGTEWPAGTAFTNAKGITAVTQSAGGAFRCHKL